MELNTLKLGDTVKTIYGREGIVIKLESVSHINHMRAFNKLDIIQQMQYTPVIDNNKSISIFYQTVTLYHQDNNTIISYTEDDIETIIIKDIQNNKTTKTSFFNIFLNIFKNKRE